MALVVKNLSANVGDIETRVPSLGREDPLAEDMATHSRILAWKIPCLLPESASAWDGQMGPIKGCRVRRTVSSYALERCFNLPGSQFPHLEREGSKSSLTGPKGEASDSAGASVYCNYCSLHYPPLVSGQTGRH